MALDPTPTLAAIRYDIGFDINQLIRDVVSDLRLQGFRIGGVLQEAEVNDDPNCARLHAVDIRTGKTACITQDRGRDAHGCKLDPSGLADISHCVTDAIKAGVDLIIINKFGRAESEGTGLLACIAEAVSADVPILTTVRDPYVDAWRSFHGGLAADLQPLKSAILDWCRASCRQPEMAQALLK
jgi:nucleoside-triphosphatase THEP1